LATLLQAGGGGGGGGGGEDEEQDEDEDGDGPGGDAGLTSADCWFNCRLGDGVAKGGEGGEGGDDDGADSEGEGDGDGAAVVTALSLVAGGAPSARKLRRVRAFLDGGADAALGALLSAEALQILDQGRPDGGEGEELLLSAEDPEVWAALRGERKAQCASLACLPARSAAFAGRLLGLALQLPPALARARREERRQAGGDNEKEEEEEGEDAEELREAGAGAEAGPTPAPEPLPFAFAVPAGSKFDVLMRCPAEFPAGMDDPKVKVQSRPPLPPLLPPATPSGRRATPSGLLG
jgi:hypothetical protein